jgi:hypothetical protein
VTPLLGFVNTGAISAVSILIRANEVENAGSIAASLGSVTLDADSAKLEGGLFRSGSSSLRGGDIKLDARSVKFRNYTISTGGTIQFNVSDSLFDSGGGANNDFRVRGGFNLLRKPDTGDLLGTTIHTDAPDFDAVSHQWAGEDRGATSDGYTNNVAIGRLILRTFSDAVLRFSGMGANNGLYVDFLELHPSVQTNLENSLIIDPNLTIYFAAANVPVDQLDGKLNGRLKWVSAFAGPNSSIDVLLANGQTIKVNRALRESVTIDSDGDGVANAFDFFPFDSTVWNTISIGTLAGERSVSLSLFAVPGNAYLVESTTNLTSPDWQPVLTYRHLAVTNGMVTITHSNIPPGEVQRYYRVRYSP